MSIKHVKGLYLWKWGFNFNEGYLAYPRVHFTIYVNGPSSWLYTSIKRKSLTIRK